MTEVGSICDENENAIVISSEPKLPFDEKIVTRKTIVYETLVDPAVIKIAGENLKDQMFAKYGFFKTAPNEVSITSIEKFYEPFIMITGKYSIDYYRKHTWTVKVENGVFEVTFPFAVYKTRELADSFGKIYTVAALEGEERLLTEFKASLALDESGKDISLKWLPSVPSEKNPQEIMAKFHIKEIPPNLDLSILRTRIQKRPADISWVANENFEVTERLVVYTPRFRVQFKHAKTGKQRVAEFDGVTGKLIHLRDSRVTRSSI